MATEVIECTKEV